VGQQAGHRLGLGDHLQRAGGRRRRPVRDRRHPLCQDWADGDECHGFRLVLGDDESHAIYATESPKGGTNPKLYAEWTQAPYPPSNLSPAGGDAVSVASPRLTWRFTDHSGKSSKQGSAQVQVFTDPDDPVGTMLFDSGKVAHTRWSYPLAGNYALAEGDVVWWRVKVWDTADFASGWSNAVQFVRTAKGDVTILSRRRRRRTSSTT
jgi:hypothetical protein